MSRGPFSEGNTLTNDSPQFTSGDLQGVLWFYPQILPTAPDQDMLWAVSRSVDNTHYIGVAVEPDGTVALISQNGLIGQVLYSSDTVNLNEWNSVGFAFYSGLYRFLWLNGVSAFAAAATWPSSLTRTSMGFLYSLTPNRYYSGYLGPIAFWTGQNTNIITEMAAFAAGMEPRWKPGTGGCQIQHYYECRGDSDVADEIGSFDFTENGTVSEQPDHPTLRRRLVYPWLYSHRGG